MKALLIAAALALTPAKLPQDLLDVRAEWGDLVSVDVVTSSCTGDANAYYFPGLELVVMCRPLMERHPLAAQWAMHHELGHAWMFQHGVPNSERGADELALLMATKEQSLAAADWFAEMAKGNSGEDGVHQGHQDRADAIRCIAYGLHDPDQTTSFCRMYAESLQEQWGRIIYLAPR